eukprot:1027931-Rhodomonas_salina.1
MRRMLISWYRRSRGQYETLQSRESERYLAHHADRSERVAVHALIVAPCAASVSGIGEAHSGECATPESDSGLCTHRHIDDTWRSAMEGARISSSLE